MARVSLFQFQDIITCVSGILIMITLLLTTLIDDSQSGTPDPTAVASPTAAPADRELPALHAKIAALRAQLDATADPSQVKAETAAFATRLRLMSPSLDALKQSQSAQAEGLKSKENNVRALEQERAALAAKVEALEQEVKDKQANLVESANTWWLVPKVAANGKLPVLVVVSDKTMTVDEFNQPNRRQKVGADQAAATFAKLLQKYNSTLHYFVFYVKPSGIATFVTLKELAQKGGFQVGFDAALENVELNFFKPTN